MAESIFKIGDVVRLKSGSPEMSVFEITTTQRERGKPDKEREVNKIKTQWFDEKNVVKFDDFLEPQLEKIIK